MKFCSINEFNTIKLSDTQLSGLKLLPGQMVIAVEGAIIRSGNSQNSRFEDMYCMALEMTLSNVAIKDFCRQGFSYYDADGKLLERVEDRTLSEEEQQDVISHISGAYLFSLEPSGKADESCVLIFDIEDEQENVCTYQIEFTFDGCRAGWDRYSGPVNGN